MRKSSTYKILAAVMALSAANWAVPANVLAGEDANGNYNVTYDGETISDSYDSYKNVYGNGHSFTITGGKIINVYGVGNSNYDKDASGGNVTISGACQPMFTAAMQRMVVLITTSLTSAAMLM